MQQNLAPIILTLGEIAITDHLSIVGQPGETIIDGNLETRIFYVSTADMVFTDLTLRNARNTADGLGGAIHYNGQSLTSSLTVTRATFENNHATTHGGAIHHTVDSLGGEVTITDSVFSNNSATASAPAAVGDVGGDSSFGGALSLQSTHAVTIKRNTFDGNSAGHGAHIYSLKPRATSTQTISDNTFTNGFARNGAIFLGVPALLEKQTLSLITTRHGSQRYT